jgi:hypothetical protein
VTALLSRLLGSPGLLLAGGIALGVAGFAAGDWWRGTLAAAPLAEARAQIAQCRAAHEKARADGAEAAVTALNDAATRARAAMADLAQKQGARAAATQAFQQEVAHAPDTYICGTSAAEHAYRRSVLGETAP